MALVLHGCLFNRYAVLSTQGEDVFGCVANTNAAQQFPTWPISPRLAVSQKRVKGRGVTSVAHNPASFSRVLHGIEEEEVRLALGIFGRYL